MGERKLRYDDVNVGDQAPALDHKLSRTDLVMYAGASGDFNPMHHDEVAAQAAGLPSVFGHGMFTAGLLATAVTNYVGIGNLASYRVRFMTPLLQRVVTRCPAPRRRQPGICTRSAAGGHRFAAPRAVEPVRASRTRSRPTPLEPRRRRRPKRSDAGALGR